MIRLARYWDNPYEFRPSRFLEDWPRDAFVPFSHGPRACIGRRCGLVIGIILLRVLTSDRFSETEAVAVIASLVSKYRVDLVMDNKTMLDGLSERERRERALHPEIHALLMYVRCRAVRACEL